MMDYVIEGLAAAQFEPYFGLDEARLIERGAIKMEVCTIPGYPCRVTLEDARPGETVILLNHVSRDSDTPYRASHAIFVREGASEPARYENAVPPVFGPRILSLRGFDRDGMMVDARLSPPGEAERDLRALFGDDAIVEIDVHNAARGCFSARTRRA